MTTGINKKIAIGAGWMVMLRWVDRLIGLVSIAILARLLLPADFGLVGYAMVFFAILEVFFLFGVETVLIRDQEATAETYNTAWTLNIIKGLILGVIIAAGAKSAAGFFNEPAVEVILYWIALVPLLRGLENIGVVDFQKNLELHKDFYFNVAARFSATVVTIILAFVYRNYWALVYGTLVRGMLRIFLSFVLSSYRPRLSLAEFSKIFHFSIWLLVQNIFSGLNERMPVLIIGRYFNAQALAFFNMGFELSSMASLEIAAPVRRALFPGIAKLQENRSQMEATLKMTVAMIVIIGLPATIGVAATAPLLIPTVLGDNWNEVIPILQVLSLNAVTYILYSNSHVIYYSLNRPRITAYFSAVRFGILLPVMLIVVPQYGVIGACWALVATNWMVLIVDYLLLFHLTNITLAGVLGITWRSVIGVVVMGASVFYVLEDPLIAQVQNSIVLHLAYCVAVGVVSYSTVVFLLWWASGRPDGAEAYLSRTLKAAVARIS